MTSQVVPLDEQYGLNIGFLDSEFLQTLIFSLSNAKGKVGSTTLGFKAKILSGFFFYIYLNIN